MTRGIQVCLFLAAAFNTSATVLGADPLETVREAFRNSSTGLKSGIGRGRYRHYEDVPGGDWQLKIDASLIAQFDGNKYHIDLTFAHDVLRKLDSRRIIYDGDAITYADFTPAAHPTGADARRFPPQEDASGLARGAWGDFPWDVTNLAKNVWNPEHLDKDLGAGRIDIKQTSEGDLVGTYSQFNPNGESGGSVRFECPRRFGFNLAKEQIFNSREARPARESTLQWKQDPNGLWYVTSIVVRFDIRDDKGPVQVVSAVVMYSQFEPNAKVDASQFTERSLQLPAGSPVVEIRPGANSITRFTR